jgi:hypothetical protein
MNKFLLGLSFGFIIFCLNPNTYEASKNYPSYKVIYDTLLTTLDPYISDAIVKHYGEPKQYSLSDAKVINITRKSEGGFSFIVKVQIKTFELALNPPYGKETILFEVTPTGVVVVDYKHEGDQWEKKINEFYEKSISDIKKSFNLDLTTFKEYTLGQLFFQSEKQKSLKSLSEIVLGIVENILNPEIGRPFKNVITPMTFINNNHGYILYKKSDGTNVIITVRKENEVWEVVNEKSKKGKKMRDEIYWYM